MKILFVGLGSIGKRHLKNVLHYLRENRIVAEIHCLKSKNSSSSNEDANKILYSFSDLDNNYDCIFITNPTHMHYDTLKNVINKGRYFFLEKPAFDNYKYDINFIDEELAKRIYVAAPLRYTPVFNEIRNMIKNESVYSLRSICSTYLPDWRPSADYREVYSAHKDQGGGVSIDCIHELDYITNLVGFPDRIYNLQDKVSSLKVDCEDISIYVARTKNVFIELHLDYFGVKARREVELITENGIIRGDFINKKVYNSSSEKEIVLDYDTNYMYVKEIEYFFESVCNHKGNWNDIYEAVKLLKIIKESEENEYTNNNLWKSRV
ncbi:Gfo/Idh/MocA family protein [Clostridium sp.]|uniref:Gfo/Idh/MocA family protein n=1 Tax=Clostridium sp. TaxID=1506 RepID=UPI003D6D3D60